jgi:phosphatidylglycerophosphatase A
LTALVRTPIRKEILIACSTGLYAGYIPVASGTFGTVVGIPFCYVSTLLGPPLGLVFIVLFIGVAVWLASEAEEIFQAKDSGLIVIDEMVGMVVTMYLIPWNLLNLVMGFFVFRFFDIVKPYPIRRLEKSLPGGYGVVGDDVLAGVYANIVLRVVVALIA